GQSIRGKKYGANRPSLIILDDVESQSQAQSPEQRAKLKDWLLKDVIPAGQTDGSSNIIMIGTCLHTESLLSELLVMPGWEAQKYQAVLNDSSQQDLWKTWRSLFTDLSDPNREETAQA